MVGEVSGHGGCGLEGWGTAALMVSYRMSPRLAPALCTLAVIGSLVGRDAAAQGLTRDSLATLVAAGDAAWARGEHATAFAAYNVVVRADSAFSILALFRVGTFHSWNDRFAAARAAFHSVLARDPANLDAQKGLVRLIAWQGDFGGAEVRWREIVAEHPDDAEAWEGLGHVLRWMGRPFAAVAALERAESLAPGNAEVRESVRRVRAEVRPAATFTLIGARDSERNTMFQLDLRGATVSRGNLRLATTLRARSLGASAGDARRVPGAAASVDWQPGAGVWTLRAEGGVVSFPAGVGAASAQGRGGVYAIGRLGPRITAGVGVGREPFDDVVSMADRALMLGSADVEVGATLHRRLALRLAASRGEVGGNGIADTRTTGTGALQWTVTRAWRATLSHREVAWDVPAYGIFFAPQGFALTEASLRWARVAELGLVAEAELGIGSQAVRFETDPLARSTASRAALRLGWRPQPGRELVAGLVLADVAGAGAVSASDYRYGALTISGRWTF
jgi:Flp pilus assembly protein TadD